MTSTTPVNEYDKDQKPSKFKFVKMKVMEDLKAETIDKTVQAHISAQATVKTDGFKSYTHIKDIIAQPHRWP